LDSYGLCSLGGVVSNRTEILSLREAVKICFFHCFFIPDSDSLCLKYIRNRLRVPYNSTLCNNLGGNRMIEAIAWSVLTTFLIYLFIFTAEKGYRPIMWLLAILQCILFLLIYLVWRGYVATGLYVTALMVLGVFWQIVYEYAVDKQIISGKKPLFTLYIVLNSNIASAALFIVAAVGIIIEIFVGNGGAGASLSLILLLVASLWQSKSLRSHLSAGGETSPNKIPEAKMSCLGAIGFVLQILATIVMIISRFW
jgi:hypothetical protein